ncbi:hypothetical protein [Streptacidiphilus sp. MAP12-33]|uniref:hypothetical protein n=1 Tax=Streptacidiphilus sp. MAP12-33 TaxID=3156266 RepID=UPI003518CDF0
MSMLMMKLLLAPGLVVGASLAGRRWGPSVAGLLVALPIVAGPILAITCLERGRGFAARAASSSLLGLVSLAVFAVVFVLLSRGSRTRNWWVTLVLAWLVCLAVDAVLAQVSVPPVVALGLALVGAGLATRALARIEGRTAATGTVPVTTARVAPWWDLPARAAVTALLVTAVTTAAAHLGPNLTGVLAPFPIATSVVAAFALAQGGTQAATATLRGVLRGLWGFAAFCFLVAVLVQPLGAVAGFGVAVVCTPLLQLVVSRLRLPGRTAAAAV